MISLFNQGLLVVFAGVLIFAQPAAADKDPIRIGILSTLDSAWGDTLGPGSVLAAQIAADEFGDSIHGKPVQIIFADHQNRARLGATQARRWLATRSVDVILDVPNGAVAEAVRPVVKEAQGLMIASGTGFNPPNDCQDNVFSWTYDLQAMSRFGLKALKESGFDTIVILNLEQRPGAGQAFREIAQNVGFKHFSEIMWQNQSRGHQIKATADSLPHELARSKDALIILGATPLTLRRMVSKLTAELQGQKIAYLFCQACASLAGNSADLSKLAQRIYYVAPYDVNGKALKRFSEQFAGRNSAAAAPTMTQIGTYTATKAYLNAVAATGSSSPASAVAAQLRTLPLKDSILGASAFTQAGVRRGSYHLFMYDPATKQHSRLAKHDMTAEASKESCREDIAIKDDVLPAMAKQEK